MQAAQLRKVQWLELCSHSLCGFLVDVFHVSNHIDDLLAHSMHLFSLTAGGFWKLSFCEGVNDAVMLLLDIDDTLPLLVPCSSSGLSLQLINCSFEVIQSSFIGLSESVHPTDPGVYSLFSIRKFVNPIHGCCSRVS